MKLDSYIPSYKKLTQNGSKDLNVRAKTIKLVEET